MKAKKIAGSIIFVVAIIALWQLLYVAGTEWFSLFKPYAVPYPLGVLKSFINLISSGTLFTAIGYSMMRALLGLLLRLLLV